MSNFDGDYKTEFILNNPIPAKCKRCGYDWIDGEVFRWTAPDGTVKERICKDAIRAPTLENVICFWCGGKLQPVDKEKYAARLKTLHLYREPDQLIFEF